MAERKVLIVGNPAEGHVGAHLWSAARDLGQPVEFMDVRRAYQASYVRQKWNWWVRGHRPAELKRFEEQLLELSRRTQPAVVLVVGIAPPSAPTLRELRTMGIQCGNYLTDDPWNRQHHAPWFMEALPEYHHVFSPRQANIEELRQRCPHSAVSYLPFAYDPHTHFAAQLTPDESAQLASDVFFAGGADPDRLPWIHALIADGWKVALYGGYWEKDPLTRSHARGIAGLDQLRRATACAKLCLCLVRRANRDGHSMRTFELPAMGGCLLVEHTTEHEAIFGQGGESVVYFHSLAEMRRQAKELLSDQKRRSALADNCRRLIGEGRHTYADRLRVIINSLEGNRSDGLRD